MAYLTMFDLVESLIVSTFGGATDAEQRDIRQAIMRAYEELATIHDWAYYSVHGRVITDAPYSTGTVTSSGNTVTLTGGTFPAWAATGGFMKIGEEIVKVATRTSGSEVVLDSTLTLKNDVTDSSYTLYRTIYPLPSDFRNMDEPSDEYNWQSGSFITPDEAMKLERADGSSGHPLRWTIIKDPDSINWAIKLIGYPAAEETIDFTYRRRPRDIRYSGHEAALRQGTISRSGSTLTGSGTAFTSAMVGSILRVGDTTNYPGPIESLTPWASEDKITAYTSATDITAGSGTIASSTRYCITDPIDIATHMRAAMRSCSEYWLARIRGVKPDSAFSMYQRDLRLALEQDQIAPLSGRSRILWSLGDWRSPLGTDGGT